MNFLELCQTLARECGSDSGAPVSVTGTTVEDKRWIDWTKGSYHAIQGIWTTWKFLWKKTTLTTTVDAAAIASLPTDVGEWDKKKFRVGTNPVQAVEYHDWDSAYDDDQTGEPALIIIMPDNSLEVRPTPDAAYTITCEYYRKPQTLTNTTDIPLIPEQFHDVIWMYAMIHYGYYDAAPEVLGRVRELYPQRLSALEASQLTHNSNQHNQSHADIVVTPV